MTLGDLPSGEVRHRLNGRGLSIRSGPFHFRIRSSIDSIWRGMVALYADHELLSDDEFVDFEVHIDTGRGLRRWFRPQARFQFDGDSPFEPLPIGHAFPLLEWAMNWCISSLSTEYLILHAAVVEREGGAAILPAPPGSGKSTLCAGLISRGWRLLSDELALISIRDASIVPLCRPVSLKNQSLGVIRGFEPSAKFGEITPDTVKGAVGHMRVPRSHLQRIDEPARPAWIVFPKYVAGAATSLEPRPRAGSLLELGRNAFNYSVLGRIGFETLSTVVDQSECYDFEYAQLDDAVAVFDALARSRRS
jgi:hypothetical protein